MEENCRKKWVSSPKKRFYWLSEVFTIYHLILMTLYLQIREELLRQHDGDLDLVRSRRQIGDRKLRRVLRDIKMIQTHLQSAARSRHGRWGDGTN